MIDISVVLVVSWVLAFMALTYFLTVHMPMRECMNARPTTENQQDNPEETT